ncbi:MAG: hypothetical protein AVDCRST_MAG27-2262 [uncultured Craurococcus sp.]|uniref:Uncharacterized protein n=1 Tax=uncultured Craurococcus sp. TaxID=1135998 RepID=A0A6J4HXK6_9PROT|nr:MAG: hypothetical protein AVDCRST_MAG27-2262 [uncultured Craurococcus sp.]
MSRPFPPVLGLATAILGALLLPAPMVPALGLMVTPAIASHLAGMQRQAARRLRRG